MSYQAPSDVRFSRGSWYFRQRGIQHRARTLAAPAVTASTPAAHPSETTVFRETPCFGGQWKDIELGAVHTHTLRAAALVKNYQRSARVNDPSWSAVVISSLSIAVIRPYRSSGRALGVIQDACVVSKYHRLSTDYQYHRLSIISMRLGL